MEDETKTIHVKKTKIINRDSGMSSAAYFLGFIGALVFYLRGADSFGSIVLGILQAIVWPAIIVYRLLAYLAAGG